MEIDELALNYQPNQAGIDVVRQSKMLLLVGIMSAGKDSLQNKLLKNPDYQQIITHTTRPPRVNGGELEQDGVHYHFVSHEQMAQLMLDHKMIEVNHFGNNFYGTSVAEFSKLVDDKKIAICNIDINGVASIHNIAPQSVIAVFIVPPSYETWTSRIEKRYGTLDSFNKEWQNRREITINELEVALDTGYYHFVINDDLDMTVQTIDDIAHSDYPTGYNEDEARLCVEKILNSIKRAF